MHKRKFTVVSQLHEKNNLELIEYIETSRTSYSSAMRETFYSIKNNPRFNKSEYNTYLQDSYNITKRTANSIISDAQGRLNALMELKRYEESQLERKIKHLKNKAIPNLDNERLKNIRKLESGQHVSLVKHRNLKRKLVAKKAKLNRLIQKLSHLKYQLDNNIYKLCFGSKYLLQRDYEKFRAQRDGQMSFVGTKTETSGNQLLQLTYNNKCNQFDIKLRKDFGGFKTANKDDKYVYGRIYFKNHKNTILSILRNRNSPLSYKIIKRNNRYYLYCTFEIQVNDDEFLTRRSYGTIGLDFNKGFITLSETNQYGHLIQTQFLPYRFKAGDKTIYDLQIIAKHVSTLAVSKGKDVCVENLNFNQKKSQTEAKEDKKYNEMIHSLAYRKFTTIIESTAYRHLVRLIKVNPAWTSWLAKQLYCPTMKLNTHVGASFVIARRGQGFKDKV